jgi:hypothetical protein
MKGIIHRWSNGLLLVAAFAATGCQTLDLIAPECTPCGVAADCSTGHCAAPGHVEAAAHPEILQCGGCSSRSCKHCWGSLGDKLRDFDWEQLHPDHCWPSQYSRESMRRVQDPLRQQMINGNILETTIWDHYFEKEEGQEAVLNSAGQARLQYLARKRPYVIPTLQLQTSFNQELDEKRIAAVKEYTQSVGYYPEMTVVNREPSGLFGQEAPKAIGKMIGPGGGPPVYEPVIKRDFNRGN